MKSLLFLTVLVLSGSLYAETEGSLFCDLFERKSIGPVYVTHEWTPYVKNMCDEHKTANGSYDMKFCRIVDFNSDGTVELNELYVEGFRELCPPVAKLAQKEEQNWFIKALIDYGNTPHIWRR